MAPTDRPHPRDPRARTGSATRRALLVVLSVVGVALGAGTAGADARPSTTAGREPLGEARPLNAPGQTLYLQRVTIPVGATLPDHFHEGTQVARVVEGVLTYDVISGRVEVTRRDGTTESVDGPATVKIRAGETLVEVASLAHAGSNSGKKPVVIELAALLATGAPLATPITSDAGTPLVISTDLTSQSTQLSTVGAGGSVTYGWNRLTGTATDASGPVQVELLGNVAYDGGEGPFFGFVTLTFADGSVLATQISGVATKDPDGTTQVRATMGVLDGTGTYLDATGTGLFTGSRTAAVGQPVRASFTLAVHTAK